MSGTHHPSSGSPGRAFALGIGLNLLFVGAEATFGVLSGSLALLADAGHNLSDVLGLALAWGATVLARRRPTERHTYGLRASSILAALLNALLLMVAVGGFAWEAVQRLGQPGPVATGTVMLVAGVGIIINAGTALLFWKGRTRDLNVRGAFLHLAADAGVSLGVVLAGALIQVTGWDFVDPVVTLFIAVLILAGTWGLLRDSVNLVLQAVPTDIDLARVRERLRGLPGVREVHDLHVWAMSTTEAALTAHLIAKDARVDAEALARLKRQLHDECGIEHVTLQVEAKPCDNCVPAWGALASPHAH
ncbi:cation diffusion facilitator family transporter [Myxococcus sp. K15C18031901]|uniref:cation diffusion facilitator family transporter n=1 Tax=Myxococcus dinghuensis TaxID=2906761 RepID=UPI0020A788E5|nr:cation diffusion facilitator family transporter [Myxococcus dinghuensis]MCP3099480.1 cation diffusion facilitator family transporter [Myxococcus dinghuensis]